MGPSDGETTGYSCMLPIPHQILKYRSGMTLIELLVTMFLAILMIAVGMPGFVGLRQSQAQGAAVNQTLGLIHFARSLAITDATTVTLCASSNMASCTGEQNFANGAVVLARDTVGQQTLIRVMDPLSVTDFNIQLRGFPSLSHIEFTDTGEINNLANAASITFCDERGAEQAAALVVNPLGMVRVAVDDDDNNFVNIHDQSDISCG